MRGIHPTRQGTRPLGPGGTIPAQVGMMALAGSLVIAAAQAVLPGTAAGLVAATATYLLICQVALIGMRRGYPHSRIGGCNAVTLLRGALTCALLMPLLAGYAAGWAVAAVACLALVLDGVDGHLARRSGLASRFGARFDMEMDAVLALVLALHVIAGTVVGAEILVLGLTRYVFVAAGWIWPWLRGDLPDRRWRKVICVLQLATLILLQLPGLTPDGAIVVARLAALALIGSFAVDTAWLWAVRR